jgi:hypothetical protein
MKKIKEPFKLNFPPVKIYRGDIEAIHDYMKVISGDIKIEAEGYEFDNLDDLFKFNKVELHSLHLFIIDPSFSIQLEPDKITLESNDNADSILSIVDKIKTVLYNRKNWAFWIMTSKLTESLLMFLPILSFYGMLLFNVLIGLLFIISSFIALYYVRRTRIKNYSQIILVPDTSNKISFLSRKKDDIIVGVAISALFMVLGLMIGHFLK